MNTETAEQPVVDPARARVLVAPDRDAEFVDFVASAGPYLHRTAYLLTGDPHQAEELVQATFERTYRAWARARTGEPRAYARRILMNLRIDGWRKDRRSGVTDDGVVPLTPVPDHAEGVAVRDELGRALRALPPGQRRVVVMRHLLDLPEAQVAEELGISVGTVKSTNARGLARLRSLLSASAVDAVPAYRADAHDVLLTARAAVRRRRVARGAVAGVLAVVLGLLLVGPVHVPGVGPVVLPGSEWLRHVLGIDGRHGLSDLPFPEPADDAVCGGPWTRLRVPCRSTTCRRAGATSRSPRWCASRTRTWSHPAPTWLSTTSCGPATGWSPTPRRWARAEVSSAGPTPSGCSTATGSPGRSRCAPSRPTGAACGPPTSPPPARSPGAGPRRSASCGRATAPPGSRRRTPRSPGRSRGRSGRWTTTGASSR
nr:hypothetical protein GCM10025730_31850 [Promicromonospora thailandica]